ncbi:hypothetical protein C8R45DRAFT_1136305 [Mycena sanguinolenta]|nr:hypothetical protein C8R45DRAFT_1136305 [Mycena sanguinolenta]
MSVTRHVSRQLTVPLLLDGVFVRVCVWPTCRAWRHACRSQRRLRRVPNPIFRAPSIRCVHCIVHDILTQRTQQVRIADYLAWYRSTGRAPPPFPPYPAEPTARAAQGLPPFFVPAPFPRRDDDGSTFLLRPASRFCPVVLACWLLRPFRRCDDEEFFLNFALGPRVPLSSFRRRCACWRQAC